MTDDQPAPVATCPRCGDDVARWDERTNGYDCEACGFTFRREDTNPDGVGSGRT